jgi:hypothetical protein
MNPAYRHARFRAELPHGGLPESFAVITVCNPEWKTIQDKENAARIEEFRKELLKRGVDHFPVTGFDPHSPHEEPGLGLICSPASAWVIGHALDQEAIFQVLRGEVSLIPLESRDMPLATSDQPQDCCVSLGSWSAMTEAPA